MHHHPSVAMVIILSLVAVALLSASPINVVSPHQLDMLLCHQQNFSESTEVILFTNFTHNISSVGFCVVNISKSFTTRTKKFKKLFSVGLSLQMNSNKPL